MENNERALGCIPSKVDLRDYKMASVAKEEALPKSFYCAGYTYMNVRNQNNCNSCVAHATSSILEYYNKGMQRMSTNYIYGIRHHLWDRDGKGMYLIDACKIAEKYGDMTYEDCPGNDEVPNCFDKALEAHNDQDKANRAIKYRIKSYFSCNGEYQIKKALMEYGPVLACIPWYDDTKLNGSILVSSQQKVHGYHAIVIYGWNEKGFLCLNSYGRMWGANGRFSLPFDYKITEARCFVDDEALGNDIVVPKRNAFLDIIYKIINTIINIIKGRK